MKVLYSAAACSPSILKSGDTGETNFQFYFSAVMPGEVNSGAVFGSGEDQLKVGQVG